MKNKL